MTQRVGEADFDYRSWRNFSAASLLESEEELFYDDWAAHRPTPAPLGEHVELFYTTSSPGLLEADEELTPRRMLEGVRIGSVELPIDARLPEIVESVRVNPVTILISETGSGKSTRVPTALIKAGWNVNMTEPLRLSARGVYERITEELSEATTPKIGNSLTSYQTAIAFEGAQDAPLKVVTDGLQLAREKGGSPLQDGDVLIIDEAHEPGKNITVMAGFARQALLQNPNIRVVVMSADIDRKKWSKFFTMGEAKPNVMEIAGRTYPVEKRTAPTSTVVKEAVKEAIQIAAERPKKGDQNSIIVMVPGVGEIRDTMEKLEQTLPGHILRQATILPLHSKLSPAEQKLAFEPVDGVKFVIATDCIQTGVTPVDAAVVVDSGLQRRVEMAPAGGEMLTLHAISRAEMGQRAGRVGRVAPGRYVLTRLNEDTPFTPPEVRESYPEAEIMRTDIVGTTLQIAARGYDIATWPLPDQPSKTDIRNAQQALRNLQAMAESGELTPRGMRMDDFPARAHIARMLHEASGYPQNVRACAAAIAASWEAGGLQHFGKNVGKRWKEFTTETSSDMLAQLDIFITSRDLNHFDQTVFNLDIQNVERARQQYYKIAKLMGVSPDTIKLPSPEERMLLKKCIYRGMVNSMFAHGGSGYYTHLGGSDITREIGDRSVVEGGAFVVGDMYRVEYYERGERVGKYILQNVTQASLIDLTEAAEHLLTTERGEYKLRDSRFQQVQKYRLFGIEAPHLTRLVEPEPSKKLRDTMVEHVRNLGGNVGVHQLQLRAWKKELEDLQKRTKVPYRTLSDDLIRTLIEEATPEHVTSPWVVDNNLGQIMLKKGITIDSFIPEADRENIRRNSPNVLRLADVNGEAIDLQLTYRNGQPLATRCTPRSASRLPENVTLEDGRQVLFACKPNGKDVRYVPLARYRIISGLTTYA